MAGIDGEARLLRRPPPPLAGDQFVAVLDSADDDRLDHADRRDGSRQFLERGRVEDPARLPRVAADGGDGKLDDPGRRRRSTRLTREPEPLEVFLAAFFSEQSGQPSTQSRLLSHG